MSDRLLHLNVNGNGLAKPPESWRQSEPPLWFLDFDSWEKLGKTAERGLLDAVFLADMLPSVDFTKPWHALDTFLTLSAVARVTSRIGLVATVSSTFSEPFDIARRVSTLDVASGGRAAVNIVTSGSDAAAEQYGRSRLPDRDVRYGRADEILTVAKQLWESWDASALVVDTEAGVLVDDAKAPTLDFAGDHVRLTARFQFPRSPQGRPLILQAGGSPQGIELAAKHADAVFCQANTIPTGQDFYRHVKARAGAYGRDPDEILILPGLSVTLGGTEAEARERRQLLDGSVGDDESRLRALGSQLSIPFELLALDQAPPWDFVEGPDWHPRSIGAANAVLNVARKEDLTMRELLDRGAGAQHSLVGTPEQVADSIEEWFMKRAADGFNINFDAFPSGLEQVVDHLVPELQRRGIFRREYAATTLRANYGLPSDPTTVSELASVARRPELMVADPSTS